MKGHHGWCTAGSREMGPRSRKSFILVQTNFPGSMGCLVLCHLQLWQRQSSCNSYEEPREEETRAPDTEGGDQLTWFHFRIKPRTYKRRHCVPWGQEIQSLLNALTQASPNSFPLTCWDQWEEEQSWGSTAKYKMTRPTVINQWDGRCQGETQWVWFPIQMTLHLGASLFPSV